MGRFSEKLHNLNLFTEIEENLVNLIKSSFPDTGKKPDSDFELAYKGLKKSDSDPDFEIYNEELTEWQINQQSICYNLPAIAMFLSEKSFFKVLYPHLQSLSDNKFINIKLSIVLPQTCLCIKQDENCVKILNLIHQIGTLAITDKDCPLIQGIMQDVLLLFKQFYILSPEDNLNTNNQLNSNEK